MAEAFSGEARSMVTYGKALRRDANSPGERPGDLASRTTTIARRIEIARQPSSIVGLKERALTRDLAKELDGAKIITSSK